MSKRLPFEVKQMLSKARESALLAVEVYNKPATKFKSGGYVGNYSAPPMGMSNRLTVVLQQELH